MIQTMFKWVGAIPLVLRVGFLGSLSAASLHGQSTNAILPTNLLQIAWSEFSSNRYVEAKQHFQAAIVAVPTNAEAYAGLGRTLYRLHQSQEAITNLERALALQPGHTNWWLSLGKIYYSANQPSKAIHCVQQYVLLRPDDAEGFTWLSFSLSQSTKYEEAVSAAKRALTLDPTNSYCYQQLGYCLEQLTRHEDAIQAFRQAIVIDPKNEDAYNQCAFSLVGVGRLDEAATVLEKASALGTDNQETHWLLLGCYLGSLQYRKACHLFPWVFAIAGCVLILIYLMGLVFLLPMSFRVRPKPFPGIWFSLAWLAVYVEGQFAFIPVLGLFSQGKTTEFLWAGVILAGVPVLLAGMFGFRQQPWGKPFAWPFYLGGRKTIWLCLSGLVLVCLFDWAYMELVERITHQPVPVQEVLLLIKSVNPLVAFLAVVVLLPVVEEILVRGLFYGALEKRLSVTGTIIVTALIFAAYHCQLAFFIPLFGVGVLLGWARSKTGSIGLPILIHALNNGLALLMVKLTENGP